MQNKKKVPKNNFLCDRCSGYGVLFERDRESDTFYMIPMYTCPKCKGKGFVDWTRHPMNYQNIQGESITKRI